MDFHEDNGALMLTASDGRIVRLESHTRLSSTAELAKEYANQGYPDRYAVFTERRINDIKVGMRASDVRDEYGVFMSLILRPGMFPSQVGLLTPLTALALASALEGYTDKDLGIGWLSSIYCNGRKIGGTSVEGRLDRFSSYEYIIISFQARLDAKSFPPRLSDMIKGVFGKNNLSIPQIIATNLLNIFFTLFNDLKNAPKHIDSYREKFALTGVRIKRTDGDRKKRCRILGVDDECRLLVEDNDRSVHSILNPKDVIIPSKIKV